MADQVVIKSRQGVPTSSTTTAAQSWYISDFGININNPLGDVATIGTVTNWAGDFSPQDFYEKYHAKQIEETVLFNTVVGGNAYKLVRHESGENKKFVLLKNDNIEYEYTDEDFMNIILDFNTKKTMEEGSELLKLL